MMEFLLLPIPERVERLKSLGEFRRAEGEIKRLLKEAPSELLAKRLEYELEIMKRLRYDYSISRERAVSILRKRIKNFSVEELERWKSRGKVDYMIIDGRERYFSRFFDNLLFAIPGLKKRALSTRDPRVKALLLERIAGIMSGEKQSYRITAGIRLRIKKKAKGKYRVWLPLPMEKYQVENVKILRHSPDLVMISDSKQRTAYFETSAREIFVEFSYVIHEVAEGIEGRADKEHLDEMPPHIVFTPLIRNLSERITDGADSDFERARRIYDWVTTHMRYFYVRNYGTYTNISEYSAVNLRGDCGFHAILFIALCRAAGIPAKWQSGWFITPYYAGPHDWAQVYVEGKWYPVDASFGNKNRHTPLENEFYFGNLDAFRMVANDDLLSPFSPFKRHWRSDPVDNQVGEVEMDDGNIYYDGFSWEIFVKEIKRI